MPGLITGTHLQPDDLGGKNIRKELGRFGEWAETVGYESLSSEIQKCMHEERDRKVEPVVKELGYKVRSSHLRAIPNANIQQSSQIKYQILRVVSKCYVEVGAETDAEAYLIPIRIEKTASGSVYDASTSPVTLAVGQRLYLNARIIVEPGMDFLLITET